MHAEDQKLEVCIVSLNESSNLTTTITSYLSRVSIVVDYKSTTVMDKTDRANNFDHLKWITKPEAEEFSSTNQPKPITQRLWSEAIANPVAHFGMLAATACLLLGLKEMISGTKERQNYYMRGRVGFQAIAFVFLGGGMYLKSQRKESPSMSNRIKQSVTKQQ